MNSYYKRLAVASITLIVLVAVYMARVDSVHRIVGSDGLTLLLPYLASWLVYVVLICGDGVNQHPVIFAVRVLIVPTVFAAAVYLVAIYILWSVASVVSDFRQGG